MNDLKLRPYAAGSLYHHEALNGTGYPQGLTKKDIPYEGQIIRVADEYDAIVSKRQYKSHIGITDTIKILIDNTKPFSNVDSSVAVRHLSENAKLGKDNPIIVKALISVVIEDINYEISCSLDYLSNLESTIKRLKIAKDYNDKMLKASNDKKRQYYFEGVKSYLAPEETPENFENVLSEYVIAYDNKKAHIAHLQDEIKKIKKLRV